MIDDPDLDAASKAIAETINAEFEELRELIAALTERVEELEAAQ